MLASLQTGIWWGHVFFLKILEEVDITGVYSPEKNGNSNCVK